MEVCLGPLSPRPKTRSTFRFGLWQRIYLPPSTTYTLKRGIPSPRGSFTPSSPHRSIRRFRNINRIPIDYPFRVCLRPRLTLIRLTLMRKPWGIGDKVFHLVYRYLCPHFLFQTLHQASRLSFTADWNAPLPL